MKIDDRRPDLAPRRQAALGTGSSDGMGPALARGRARAGAGDVPRFVNGRIFHVDGGLTASLRASRR